MRIARALACVAGAAALTAAGAPAFADEATPIHLAEVYDVTPGVSATHEVTLSTDAPLLSEQCQSMGTGARATSTVSVEVNGVAACRFTWDLDDSGAEVLTVDDGGAVSAEFVPLARRRYEILTVDVTGAESPAAALAAALPADAGEDCYRIVLTGERGEEPPELAALAALAEPRFYSVTLRDQTRERRALWARSGEDSLTGLFLRTLRSGAQEGDGLELAARFGLAALENGEDPCL